jgi:hypothetical protein
MSLSFMVHFSLSARIEEQGRFAFPGYFYFFLPFQFFLRIHLNEKRLLCCMAKPTAYYSGDIDPATDDVDGMWITREPPYVVENIWRSDSERPRLADEPAHIRGYVAGAARREFDFEKVESLDDLRHL